ncbi:MAG: prephenate dehydrogenase [Clostridia bacterium]|nr:prephenate dehydrogenase [Clostridia bacterium]MBR6702034.1 prephenate dehydrogenase [Clostridia bacterium]
MKLLNTQNVLIVGLGLMGGSYAKALRRLDFHISAIDTNRDSIDYAVENNIIDEGSCSADSALIEKADIIVFALYPKLIKEWIETNQQYFKSGAIITDVTGVKSCIVYDIQELLRDDVEFIAAHPMAGREVYGVRNSTEKMFRDANFLVVPTEKNSEEAIEWCKELGRLLGFINVTVLSPEEHDRMIGFVSQLTHCIAVALMTCSDNTHLADYTADSFRDLTRIANINEVMWSELFLLNKEPLLADIDRFINEMKTLRDMLENGDREGLMEKMKLSTERRAAFNK